MNFPQNLISWESFGQAKIVLKTRGEKELRNLRAKGIERKIPTGLIVDNGHTQIPKGTVTCCAIGPGSYSIGLMKALISEVDAVTGHLKLY